MKNKTILVTGARGFVGRSLVRQLQNLNVQILSPSSNELNVTDPGSFEKFSGKKADHVIHLAGKTFVPQSWKEPAEFLKVNGGGTANVAEFCRKNGISLTYVSAYVYGSEVKNPISESHTCRPNNPYAVSKRIGEEICEHYMNLFQLNCTIVRPFNIYGSGQPETFLIPEIIEQLRGGNQIIVNDLSPRRDYIHVEDLSRLLIKTVKTKHNGIINAGTGVSTSVEELISIIQEVNGSNLKVVSRNQERNNEISNTVADITRAFKAYKWKPEISLRNGIQLLLAEKGA